MPLQPIINYTEMKYSFINQCAELYETNEELIGNILHIIDYHNYLILICCRLDKNFFHEYKCNWCVKREYMYHFSNGRFIIT